MNEPKFLFFLYYCGESAYTRLIENNERNNEKRTKKRLADASLRSALNHGYIPDEKKKHFEAFFCWSSK